MKLLQVKVSISTNDRNQRKKKKTSSEKCGEEETQKVSKKEKRWIMKRRNRWTQNTKKYAEEFKDNGEYQENM